MKKIIVSAIVMAFVLVSCTKKTEESSTVTSDESATEEVVVVKDTVNEEPEILPAKLYSCSMHPEVQGKQNDKCTKCDMSLTELVPGKAE